MRAPTCAPWNRARNAPYAPDRARFVPTLYSGRQKMFSRREALTATLKLAGAVAGQALVGGARAEAGRDRNARVPYGSCVRPEALETEVDYRAAFLTHCQQITPEGG